jgi:hypothetical protein
VPGRSLLFLGGWILNRWIVAFALVCGIFASTRTPAPATTPSFTICNSTGQVAFVEVEQLTPFSRWVTLYINPRRTESRYLTGSLGRFEVRVTVYSGGTKIKLPPKQMTVRSGNEGRITVDSIATGKNGENADFGFTVVSAP